jgi:signal transduction histidine kinase
MAKKQKNRLSTHFLLILFPVILTVVLFAGVAHVKYSIDTNKQTFFQAMGEVNGINEVITSLSDLSRWQLSVVSNSDEKKIYHAERRSGEVEAILAASIKKLSASNSEDMDSFLKNVNALIEINRVVITDYKKRDSIEESLIEFRSLYGIIQYSGKEFQKDITISAEEENFARLMSVVIELFITIGFSIVASIFLGLNIYKRHEAELELRKTRNYLNNVINSMPSMIVGIEPDGTVMEINRKAEIACGVPAGVAKGKNASELFPIMAPFLSEISDKIDLREIVYKTNIPLDDEGKNICNITAFPLVMNGIQGAVIRLDDVTKQVKMEEQLRQSQKMTAVGQLAGGISHDFNNMLGGIIGGLELVEEYVTPEGLEYFELINTSAHSAADLVKQLLSFSRKNKFSLVPVDMNATILAATKLLEHSISKTVTIKMDLTQNDTFVLGDAAQLQNIFMNLGINSSHAIDGVGTVTYASRVIEIDSDYCESSQFELSPGSYFQVEVSDTGCGIDVENLNRIFEPFFTTKDEGQGTGLGLSTVYGVIQDMKGAITVYSEIGRGTKFNIVLPLSTQPKMVDEQPFVGDLKSSGKILVIDDEEVIQKTARAILTKAGFEVLVASNGIEGIKIYSEESDIDLVLLDMIMPVMNGRDCFFELRKIKKDLPVILASGFSQHRDVDELRSNGLNGFMRKPYRSSELLTQINRVLRTK